MTAEGKPERKVGIYDRPARADRRLLRWLPMLVALVVGFGWLAYLVFAR